MSNTEFRNLQIGKSFFYKGKKLQVSRNEKNQHSCAGCYFRNYSCSECVYLSRQGAIPQCTQYGREDRSNVIFVEVE